MQPFHIPDSVKTIRVFFPVLMVVLVAGLYVSSLDNPFMLDDIAVIVNNPDVVEPGGMGSLWLHDIWNGQHGESIKYQPLTVLTYRLNAQMTGLSPVGFRVVNAGLLGLVGLLVALWIGRYTGHPAAAALAGFVFVAHPANAESVNHLVGRSDLLAMVGVVGFALVQRLVLELLGAHRKRGIEGPVRVGAVAGVGMAAGLVFASVALLSSDTGLVVIPVAVAQGWVAYPRKKGRPTVGIRCVLHGATAICVAVPAWVYLWGYEIAASMAVAPGGVGRPIGVYDVGVNPLAGLELAERVPAALTILSHYGGLVVRPGVGFYHSPWAIPGWDSASTLSGVFLLLTAVGVLGATAYRRHWGTIAVVLVLSQYVLVSNLGGATQAYASNLRSMPFTVAGAFVLAWLINRTTGGSTRARVVAAVPCAVVVGMSLVLVLKVNELWFSPARLMAAELARRPEDPVAMYHYGSALVNAGRFERGAFWLEGSLGHRASSMRARHQLALARLMRGDTSGARTLYVRILDMDGGDVRACAQLANMALAESDLVAARGYVERAVGMQPLSVEVMLLRARLAAAEGDVVEAERWYRVVLEREGGNVLAREGLAGL